MPARPKTCVVGVSLIEVLVVLFIMGIMMSMYLPALSRVRARASVTVCENNVHQLNLGLRQYMQAQRRFPLQSRWTVDILPYIEQRPLADAMASNRDTNATFPRPAVMQCPLQNEFSSRIDGVGFCHYRLVVDRPAPVRDDGTIIWVIEEREELTGEISEEPWWIGPDMSFLARDKLMSDKKTPHEQQGFF